MGLTCKPCGKLRSRWDKMLNGLKKAELNAKKAAPRKERKKKEEE